MNWPHTSAIKHVIMILSRAYYREQINTGMSDWGYDEYILTKLNVLVKIKCLWNSGGVPLSDCTTVYSYSFTVYILVWLQLYTSQRCFCPETFFVNTESNPLPWKSLLSGFRLCDWLSLPCMVRGLTLYVCPSFGKSIWNKLIFKFGRTANSFLYYVYMYIYIW